MEARKKEQYNRLSYLLLTFFVIVLGLLSRKISFIPLIVGDILYAVMMFTAVRFVFIQLNSIRAAILSLSICYFIELGQLYKAGWIEQCRNTVVGGLILGHGFLWSDMLAYTAGIIFCLIVIRITSGTKDIKTENVSE